jgi:hypothetical protein
VLLEEYEIRHLTIVDGDADDLRTALEHLDPDQVSLGGYCREDCGGYWKGLMERAIIPRQTRPPRPGPRSGGSS